MLHTSDRFRLNVNDDIQMEKSQQKVEATIHTAITLVGIRDITRMARGSDTWKFYAYARCLGHHITRTKTAVSAKLEHAI